MRRTQDSSQAPALSPPEALSYHTLGAATVQAIPYEVFGHLASGFAKAESCASRKPGPCTLAAVFLLPSDARLQNDPKNDPHSLPIRLARDKRAGVDEARGT